MQINGPGCELDDKGFMGLNAEMIKKYFEIFEQEKKKIFYLQKCQLALY